MNDSKTITMTDHGRLSDLAALYARREPAAVESLIHDLARARIVPTREVHGSIVTMKTRVTCRTADGKHRSIELVYPRQADPARGRISVLAPLGRALLGAAIGDVITFEVGGSQRRWRVEALHYQPEASGDFEL